MSKVKRISLLVFWKHAFKISDFFSIINQLQAINSVVIFYVLYLKPKVLFSFTSGQYYWWYDEIFSEIHFYLKTISKAFLSFFFSEIFSFLILVLIVVKEKIFWSESVGVLILSNAIFYQLRSDVKKIMFNGLILHLYNIRY